VTASFEYEKCLDRYSIAEIVGSNPSTLSTFIILVTYGINSSVFWIVVGQFEQQCHCYANNNISSNTLNGGFQQLQTTIF